MESKLVVKSKYTNSTNKKALIIYENVNNLNFLYRKLLQSNGYQVYFNANFSNVSGNVVFAAFPTVSYKKQYTVLAGHLSLTKAYAYNV